MRLTLRLLPDAPGTGPVDVPMHMPAVPQHGDQILYTDQYRDDDAEYYRTREYRVVRTRWALSSDGTDPHAVVMCEFVADLTV